MPRGPIGPRPRSLSVGEGQMVNLPRSRARASGRQRRRSPTSTSTARARSNLFGKGTGEATVIATAADGSVVYGANVRVGQNISSINEMLQAGDARSRHQRHADRPDRGDHRHRRFARGRAPRPDASRALNPGVDVSGERAQDRADQPAARSATPLQVKLKVAIAEVNRTLLKQIGVNLLTPRRDRRVPVRHRPGQPGHDSLADASRRAPARRHPRRFNIASAAPRSALAGKLLGLDLLGTLDLAAERRPGHHPRRAEPDRAFGRDRQLPRRRRIPDPDLAVARRGHDRI